jgi:acyl carrier protein
MKVTLEDVISIIKSMENLTINLKELIADRPFVDQGIDSLDRMSIFLNIEDAYGVKIPDEEIDKLISVEKIVEYLNSTL